MQRLFLQKGGIRGFVRNSFEEKERMKPMFSGVFVIFWSTFFSRFLLDRWCESFCTNISMKRCLYKMGGQGFGRNSGQRMYVEPFRWECTAQTHCVLGLAEIPSLPHSLPDDRMRHIFSRDFRKDFTPRYCNIRTTPRHNVILNNEIVLICHRIPVWIFPKIFHCIFDTLFEEIGDIITSFLEFSVQKSVIFSTASSRATFFL